MSAWKFVHSFQSLIPIFCMSSLVDTFMGNNSLIIRCDQFNYYSYNILFNFHVKETIKSDLIKLLTRFAYCCNNFSWNCISKEYWKRSDAHRKFDHLFADSGRPKPRSGRIGVYLHCLGWGWWWSPTELGIGWRNGGWRMAEQVHPRLDREQHPDRSWGASSCRAGVIVYSEIGNFIERYYNTTGHQCHK